MGLLKLVKNRISSEWKEIFNHNVDYLSGLETKVDSQNEATNSRIDNLVLNAGGDSPNEAVDARVNSKGEKFATLQSRLVASENKHDEDVYDLSTKQTNTAEQLDQLNKSVAMVIGGSDTVLDLYVSASRGNDKTGDGTEEKPFKTIQTAINQIPLISVQVVTVWIDDGVYLEDVVLRSINANQIFIKAQNNFDNIDLAKSDLPVKVRSVAFYYCSGYFQIAGLQAVDVANTPQFEGIKYSFLVEQGGYLAINKCKCAENSKNLSFTAIYIGGNSKCNIYGGVTFINQNIVTYARLLSEVNIGSIQGSGNNLGIRCATATVRGTVPSGFATNASSVEGNGLIISKGTVLS